MQEDAVLVRALSEVGEEPALGHAVPVELVQEVAVVALLAQPAQPVLAHDLVPPGVDPHAGSRRRLRLVGLDAEHGVQLHAKLVFEVVHCDVDRAGCCGGGCGCGGGEVKPL